MQIIFLTKKYYTDIIYLWYMKIIIIFPTHKMIIHYFSKENVKRSEKNHFFIRTIFLNKKSIFCYFKYSISNSKI